jgi:hypothetical protein
VVNPRVIRSCRLCGISAGRYNGEYDTPVLSGSDYFGVASIGGFIPGWSLLCPHKHSHNLAADYREETIHQEISHLVRAVTRSYNEIAIFEHGSIREGSATACGTSHAHLHIVPFVGALADLALVAEPSLPWESVPLQAVAEASNGCEYLFVANRYDGPETVGQLARLSIPRSQFFRRLLAEHLQLSHLADYREAPLEQLSIATSKRVRAAALDSRRAA